MPIVIFHGDIDNVINVSSSFRLKNDFPNINFIKLPGQGHNGMSDNEMYKSELPRVLGD
ncbi:MAG TPA: hypothetical protein VL728_17330 [Cyclobacteriaceae bacterium]|nr:hypothetical protein [Cyclobacteriaceae bacterium]